MAGVRTIVGAVLFLLLSSPASIVRAEIGGDFTLTDHYGEPFHLNDHRGKVVMMFFGFTYCPSICPDTLSKISRVVEQLGDSASQVSTVFISVDPERDTVEALARYVPYFSASAFGLTGTTEAIKKVSEQYKARYKVQKKSEADTAYNVDHTADIYVLNRDGEVVSIIPYGMPADHILKVVRETLKEAPAKQTETVHEPDKLNLVDLDGYRNTISQWHGKSLLINFWATWCTPCRTELPSLNNVWKQADKHRTQMLAVNVGESAGAVSAFLKDYPIDFPVLLDESAGSMGRWDIKGFPTTIMLDDNGELLWKITGDREWDSEEMLAKIRRVE